MIEELKKKITFIKYILTSLTCFGVDILLFTLINLLLKGTLGDKSIIISTIIARIISSFINYLFNGKYVFNTSNKIDIKIIIKYYLLVVFQMIMSSFWVYTFHSFMEISETIIKIFVDTIIFLVNYFINKKFIFIKKEEQ